MSEKSTPANDIAQLIQLGREQGYLTHSDITDTLPDGSTDEDNFEEIIQVLGDMGIKVFENTPDQDELMHKFILIRCILENLNPHVSQDLNNLFKIIFISRPIWEGICNIWMC